MRLFPAGFLAALLVAFLAACGDGGAGSPSIDAGVDAKPDAAHALPDAAEPTDSGAATDAGLHQDAGEEPDAGGCVLPEAGGPGPSGYALDGWDWKKRGLLFEDPQAGAGDGYIAPAVVEANGALHLFFVRKTGLEQRILYAKSTDGESWTSPVPVTGLGSGTVFSSPSVLHAGRRFKMWFGSGAIDLAESIDGVEWTVLASGVLGAGAQGAFDSLSVLYPSVVQEVSGYSLFYTGFNGQTYAIGRALSADGREWSREPVTPVLSAGAAQEFDNTAVAQPRVLRTSAGYLMWFSGYDTSLTNPGPYRVGLARSDDGVSWTKVGVSLDLSAAGHDACSTRDAAPFVWQGAWRMVYVGMGTDYRYRLLLADSAACVP
ncbi:MAG: hypothetical protein ACOX6T_19875 [Myxococcales bacterium]|jgi:predicted GH43/DUF377 family glycosyl hydrolase